MDVSFAKGVSAIADLATVIFAREILKIHQGYRTYDNGMILQLPVRVSCRSAAGTITTPLDTMDHGLPLTTRSHDAKEDHRCF